MEEIVRRCMTRMSHYQALVGTDLTLARSSLVVINPNWESLIPKGYELEVIAQGARNEAVIFLPNRDVLSIVLPALAPIKVRALSSTVDPQTPMLNCSKPD